MDSVEKTRANVPRTVLGRSGAKPDQNVNKVLKRNSKKKSIPKLYFQSLRHREKSIRSNLTVAFATKWCRKAREASRKIDPQQPHESFCD